MNTSTYIPVMVTDSIYNIKSHIVIVTGRLLCDEVHTGQCIRWTTVDSRIMSETIYGIDVNGRLTDVAHAGDTAGLFLNCKNRDDLPVHTRLEIEAPTTAVAADPVSAEKRPVNTGASPESDFLIDIFAGNCEITKYVGNDRHIVIPERILGHTVTSIGPNAFSRSGSPTANFKHKWGIKRIESMQSVVIPRTVTNIGIRAFSGCVDLVQVLMHDSIQTIGPYAFWGCEHLRKLDLGCGYDGPGTVYFPKTLKSIGYLAFSCHEGMGENARTYCLFRQAHISRATNIIKPGKLEKFHRDFSNTFDGCEMMYY